MEIMISQKIRGHININDPKNKCNHKVKIPGLDAFLCSECNKWIITDLSLIKWRKNNEAKEKEKANRKRK